METVRTLQADVSPIPDVPLSFESRVIFQLARRIAGLPESGRLGNAHVGTEHLLIILAQAPTVSDILRASGIAPEPVIAELKHYIAKEDDNLPKINEDGLTPTVIQTINIAKRLAHREQTNVTPVHLYEGMIMSGRGKALMVLGTRLGYAQENLASTPLIQERLLSFIPHPRPIVE